MANSDKNIVITPATNTSGDPKIVYTPNTAANVITQRLTDAGAISFEGSAGQLFSITNSLSGTLFAVNDVSGIPSIEVIDTGLIRLGQYSGSVVLGSAAALQNASNVASKMSVVTGAATTPGLILRGVASQSANMFDIQDSTAATKFYIRQDGFAVSSQGFQGTINAGQYFVAGVPLTARSYAAASIVSIIRGALDQTANLTEWQSSTGTILSSVNSAGQFTVVSLTSNGSIPIGASNSQATGLELGNSTGTATTPFIDFHSGEIGRASCRERV